MSTSITTERRKKSGSTRLMRIFLPALLILVWLVGAGIGGPYFGKVSEVSSNSQTTYLPESADATQVQEQLGDFTDSESIPAIVVMVSDDSLTQQDIAQLNEVVAGLSALDIVSDEVSPAIPSEDGRAVQVFVPLNPSAELTESVEKLSETLAQQTPDYVSTYVTGPAGFTADLSAAFAGIDGLLLAVALAAVLVILVIVYRSFILPIAVLATSLFALTVALLVVWWLAKWDILLLSGQTQGILFILVIGAATDYSLLYVARFREELRVQQDKGIATGKAIRASVEPILASGSTVIAGLLCLLFSDLKSNSTLGPVASVGIIFAMLSALTLLPALLFVFGRVAFWPKRPKYEPERARAKNDIPASGIWSKVAHLVERHPRAIWVSTLIVLLLGAAFVPTLKADGVSQSDLVLGSSEARDGQQALGEHFPGGSGSPAYIIVDEAQAAQVAGVVLNNDNFEAVTVTSADSPSGSAPITAGGIVPLGSGTAPAPVVVEGQVLLQATLVEAPDSEEAQKAIRSIRQTFADENISAVVGGVTATSVDTNDASKIGRAHV